MAKHILFLVVFLFSLSHQLAAQVSDVDKKRQAKEFISHERYQQALAVLNSSTNLRRHDKEARLLMAVSYYQTNQLDAALRLLNELTTDGRSPYPECWLYLAKIYHSRHQFAEATDHYKTYLRSLFPNHPHRRMVIEEIRRCSNGLQLMFQAAPAVVENLGRTVNTPEDEFAPVASPTRSDRLYFSAIRQQNTGGPRDAYGRPDPQWGRYFSDMYVTEVSHGQWSAASPMNYLLNSPRHDVLLGFDDQGQALYFYKGWNMTQGEIVVDTFREIEARRLSSTPLVGPLQPQQGDNYPVFYQDTLVIFASNRPGGHGGWDLYKSVRKKGRWSPPINLGPTVNTPFDETTPFLAHDGRTLYFSSNDSQKSLGGLDVFKTHFVPKLQQWLPPANVGLPINSAGDDSHFRISRDGFTAFLCSSRKDGFGQRDIYIAHFQDFLPEMEFPEDYYVPPPVSQVQPTTPSTIPIKIVDPAPEEEIAYPPTTAPTFTTAPADPPNPAVSISHLLLKGATLQPEHYPVLDRLADQLRQEQDLKLVITAYADDVRGRIAAELFAAIRRTDELVSYLQRKGVNDQQLFVRATVRPDESIASQLIEFSFTTRSGAEPPAGIPLLGQDHPTAPTGLLTNAPTHYKVQVASALNAMRENFLEGYPYPMVEKTPDFAYYRYTLGAFTDKSEAERFRQKIRQSGRTSAYVATYVRGCRVGR